ncbi:unnamed protein product [Notodromas monacha]|uniref:Uncharacterized protein n=1 Tax=Notodromas monacha TaxID=399045 RepID=A0A7R9BQB9_9CRUS|nr:unnamed protein product [Notodromas monacha]CAG0918350.1 unnamed protein product [Notodromas monacha]
MRIAVGKASGMRLSVASFLVVVLTRLVPDTGATASFSEKASSGMRKPRTRGNTPNEIDQWPELLVDLPAFGRQVILEPKNDTKKVQKVPMSSSPVVPVNVTNKDLRKSNRRAEPDINDFISGLVKMLGGQANVHVAEPERRKHTNGNGDDPGSSRINNRGPPSLSELPPSIPPGLISSNLRPPSRQPPPHQQQQHHLHPHPNPQQRPTRRPPPPPPGPAPLPPQNSGGKVRFPDDSAIPPPFTSGVPIPEQLVPLQRPPGNLIPLQRPVSTSSSSSTTTTTTTTTSTTTFKPVVPTTQPEIPEPETEVVLEPSEDDYVMTSTSHRPGGGGRPVYVATQTVSSISGGGGGRKETSTSGSRWKIVDDDDERDPGLVPGVVVDDEDVMISPSRPVMVDIITASETLRSPAAVAPGDVFDVTVSANQGFGSGGHDFGAHGGDIIASPIEKNGGGDFVSIDGRKTYFNLLPTGVEETSSTYRDPVQQTVVRNDFNSPPLVVEPELAPGIGIGTGFIRPLPPDEATEILGQENNNKRRRPGSPQQQPPPGLVQRPGLGGGGGDGLLSEDHDGSTRRPFTRRPAAPPVRQESFFVSFSLAL